MLPDGRALSGSGDGALRLWDLESGDSRVLEGHTAGVWALAVLPDGRAVSGSGDGTRRLWDLESGDSRVLEGHTAGVWALAVLPDGRALSGSADQHPAAVGCGERRQPRAHGPHGQGHGARGAARRPRAVRSGDWSVIVWDVARGTPIAAFVGDAPMTCVAATPTHIIVGAADGAVHLLRLRP